MSASSSSTASAAWPTSSTSSAIPSTSSWATSTSSTTSSSSSSSSSSGPFSPCFTLDDNCWSTYTESLGYCCPNALCDPYGDCSFGAGSSGPINTTAALSTSTVLFVLCVGLFVFLLYRRWRLRRDFMGQLQYLSYLEAASEHDRERRMADAVERMGHADDALEMNELRVDDSEAGEADEDGPVPAAAAAGGRARGGFKAFTGRAFTLGEIDDEETESTALHDDDRPRSDSLSESQHSIDLSSDDEFDEKKAT